MDRPDLAEDEKYQTHSARGANQVELDAIVSDWTCTIDAAELEELMSESGIPSGKIYRAPEMLEDAHFKAREAIIKTQHPEFGELLMQNVAPKLSATPGSIRLPGPALGQHNEEIYRQVLNYDDDRLATLATAGII
jgi:formyl-CoA transferase